MLQSDVLSLQDGSIIEPSIYGLSKMSAVGLPVLLLSPPCFSLGKFSALYCNIIICHMINPLVLTQTFRIVGIK